MGNDHLQVDSRSSDYSSVCSIWNVSFVKQIILHENKQVFYVSLKNVWWWNLFEGRWRIFLVEKRLGFKIHTQGYPEFIKMAAARVNLGSSTRVRHFRTGQKKYIWRVLKCLDPMMRGKLAPGSIRAAAIFMNSVYRRVFWVANAC